MSTLTKAYIKKIVKQALTEDQVSKDITTRLLVPNATRINAQIISKQNAILSGINLAKESFQQTDKNLRVLSKKCDGQMIKKGDILLSLSGKAQSILKAERTALNFLGYLSGIATHTHQFINAIRPYKTQILDTRKTTPTLRILEKYAVTCGGGTNHRFDLSEMVLIKDNHRFLYLNIDSLSDTIKDIRRATRKKIEVEVDSLKEFYAVISAQPDSILLDNMTTTQIRTAVKFSNRLPKQHRPALEASGGVTLKTVKKIAATGVNRISIGCLTHSHQSIDMSLEFIK